MKLCDYIRSRAFPGRYIIQLSPVRTGSTLVYNVLRDVFRTKTIKKAHKFDSQYARLHIVCTVRHPLDCIASLIKIKGAVPDHRTISEAIAHFDQTGLHDLIRVANNPKAIVFKYEDFFQDMSVVYDGLERRFGIVIPDSQRYRLNEEHGIEAALKRTCRMDGFSCWDPITNLHGNHISESRGMPLAFKGFFRPEQIEFLESHYFDYMEFFGYDISGTLNPAPRRLRLEKRGYPYSRFSGHASGS